jgi:flagellar basal-body rod modification protein FlgD
MAAIAGILNHHLTGGKSLSDPSEKAMAATSGSPSSTDNADSDSATISANDFLTLLVTEMKNQDPTANTDPNEYINQLVQVNSLEQLIDINQNVSNALGDAASPDGSSPSARSISDWQSSGSTAEPSRSGGDKPSSVTGDLNSSVSSIGSAIHDSAARLAPGNLSVPGVNSAAQDVARALNGHSRSSSTGAILSPLK